MKRGTWTARDLTRLREMRNAGKSYRECAEALQRTEKAISRAVLTHGLQLQRNRRWTRDDIRQMIRMRAAGKQHAEIAAALGHPHASVACKWPQVARRMRARAAALLDAPA